MQKNDAIKVILFTSKQEELNINKIIYNVKAECPGVTISHFTVEGFPERARQFDVKKTPCLIIDDKKKAGCISYTLSIDLSSSSPTGTWPVKTQNLYFLNKDRVITKEEETLITIESIIVERICFVIKVHKLEMDIHKLTKSLKISHVHILIIIAIWIVGILWLLWLRT